MHFVRTEKTGVRFSHICDWQCHLQSDRNHGKSIPCACSCVTTKLYRSALIMQKRQCEGRYAYEVCHGICVVLHDRQVLDATRLGLESASALVRLPSTKFELARTVGFFGARWVVSAIRGGQDPRDIGQQWQAMPSRQRGESDEKPLITTQSHFSHN